MLTSWRHARSSLAHMMRFRDSDTLVRTPRLIVSIMLFGTLFFVATGFIMVLLSGFLKGNDYVLNRLWLVGFMAMYLLFAVYAMKRNQHKVAAWMVVGLYFTIGALILLLWSINAPVGILILSFVVVLAGTMLGSRYIIYLTAVIVTTIFCLQVATSVHLIKPDTSSLALPPGFGDTTTYGIIFCVVALVSWLSSRQMERALVHALKAEEALKQEKKLLAKRLEEKTRSLKEAQFEEMRQIYRFAEVGRMSTALLHDLANHLTILVLSIDDLEQRHKRSEEIRQAKDSIAYLEVLVSHVRQQFKSSSSEKTFDIVHVVTQTYHFLEARANADHIEMTVIDHIGEGLILEANGSQLAQVVAILINNAFDALKNEPSGRKKLKVKLTKTATQVKIEVIDNGKGVPPHKKRQLFIPHVSDKDQGMGVGLYIARQIIQTDFSGTLTYGRRQDNTIFTVTIPLS